MWQQRGIPVRVPAAGTNVRRAVFGALDYASGQVIWQITPHKNGEAFAAFLKQIAERWPDDQLILVMDNVSYHRSPVIRRWWTEQDGRITPLWLPVYTPTLNLIERVWRYLKQKLACHRFWDEVDGLEHAAASVLDHIEAHFHTADPPSIRMTKDLCEAA